MAVNPLAGEASPMTFRSNALYNFKIDPSADVIEDLDHRVTFGEPDSNGVQRIESHRLEGSAAAEFERNGTLIAEGNTGDSGLNLWIGSDIHTKLDRLYQ